MYKILKKTTGNIFTWFVHKHNLYQFAAVIQMHRRKIQYIKHK